MTLRAKDYPKLHAPDPSGVWHLIRTGEKLPKPGDQIQFTYDIRGTMSERRRQVFVDIAKGDPYKITNDALDSGKPVLGGAPGAMLAEFFKLPTEAFAPTSHVGKVDDVFFDKPSGDWMISIDTGHASVWSESFECNCIIYWKPLESAPAGLYHPRIDDGLNEWSYEDALYRDTRVHDTLESRKYNRNHKEEA